MFMAKVKKEHMLKKCTIIFLIIFSFLVLDIITKKYAVDNLILSNPIPINDFINFSLAFNYGAAFSLLSDAGGWQRWFFIVFSIIVILVIAYIILRDENSGYIAFSLILSGAIGNLYDRIAFGYVIDFIELHYKNFYWPIFNVADIAITIGVILLLYSMTLKNNKIL
tara:strand:+ start:998 stop:1498 length:501 start_codon:yes stop_codon:yes gene_type:complete